MLSVPDTTLYERLGLASSASSDEIRRSYHQAARRWHPDRNPGDPVAGERFKACLQAYEILSNRTTRTTYDQHGPSSVLPSARVEQERQQQRQQQQEDAGLWQQQQEEAEWWRQKQQETERWRQQQAMDWRRQAADRQRQQSELRRRLMQQQECFRARLRMNSLAMSQRRQGVLFARLRGAGLHTPGLPHAVPPVPQPAEPAYTVPFPHPDNIYHAVPFCPPPAPQVFATAYWASTDPSTGTTTTSTATSSQSTASFSYFSFSSQSTFSG